MSSVSARRGDRQEVEQLHRNWRRLSRAQTTTDWHARPVIIVPQRSGLDLAATLDPVLVGGRLT